MSLTDQEDEWEYEDDEEEEEVIEENSKTKPDIKILGNLITIDRSKVDWSDDEEEEEAEETTAPPPPPPPPAPAPPPPPPPPKPPAAPSGSKDGKSEGRAEKLEMLKKRPTKRPDWNDLMKEIEKFRCSHGLLKKTVCSDRSKPILTKTKVKGMFVYDSEKDSKNADILKDIQKGAKLRHVRCNDRSKPNLRGIKSFKRQLTKEEKNASEFSFTEDFDEEKEDTVEILKLKDDLESTKQLLELEVRSKQLLDKNNKKLQNEIEQLRADLLKFQAEGIYSTTATTAASAGAAGTNSAESAAPPVNRSRKNSLIEKRRSIIRCSSENAGEIAETPELPEEIVEIAELKEEADEARKLAEEWENKYKEMQRQMEDFEVSSNKKLQSLQSQEHQSLNGDEAMASNSTNEDDWLQRRELQQIQTKIRSTKEKKLFLEKERRFLNERLDNLKDSISQEVESRKVLKREIREMNAAFRQEMAEIEEMERLEHDLDEVYISDEDELVHNTYHQKVNADDMATENNEDNVELDEEEDDVTLDDILRSADDMMEEKDDVGGALFFLPDNDEDSHNTTNNSQSHSNSQPADFESQKEQLNASFDTHSERLQLMRKSNFLLKSRIDVLSDLLQAQKEKHQDLKQDLNRMLVDIQ